jgi:methylthioribose-1-phosphate isomerase
MSFKTIEWRDDTVVMLNQLLLPHKVIYETYREPSQVAAAIKQMVIRGAPAIGIAAAMGIALGVINSKKSSFREIAVEIALWSKELEKTRPTAVNLFWAIERMKRRFYELEGSSIEEIKHALVSEAQQILVEDIAANRKIGEWGARFVRDGDVILTHCNAGALATGGYGTATSVIRVAHEQSKQIKVIADETRPYLQGSRLTAWELMADGIPVEIITDNMAGYLLKRREVDLCIVGTDRTAANGDVANKIGTYMLALAAHANDVPFYVAAPTSSIDLSLSSGDLIPIEERDAREVTHLGDVMIAPHHAAARHIAFDVTPARYVTAIFTENGVASPPYAFTLPDLVRRRNTTL